MQVQIKDSKYVRDLSSKAVLNTDKQALEEYLIKREIARKAQNEQFETKERISKVEHDMAEIKMLLHKLLGQRDTNAN
jgi:hypothetical protein